MFRRFVMLAVAVSILGFSVGCGGAGDATTIKAEDRPAGLRQDTDGKPNTNDEGINVPEGVIDAEG
jgi:hypothetical protein